MEGPNVKVVTGKLILIDLSDGQTQLMLSPSAKRVRFRVLPNYNGSLILFSTANPVTSMNGIIVEVSNPGMQFDREQWGSLVTDAWYAIDIFGPNPGISVLVAECLEHEG
jgi:hypothetical protein